jgi:hypothetical protein
MEAELLAFPAAFLPELPIPVRFSLEGAGITQEIVWATYQPEALPAGTVWFDGEELRALAAAAQAERLWPADFKGFCLRKLHDPGFRVNELVALDGAQPVAGEDAWPLGRVLERLDLRLGALHVGQALSEPPADAPPQDRGLPRPGSRAA